MHSFRQEANNKKVLIVIINNNNNNNISFIIIAIRSWVLYCDEKRYLSFTSNNNERSQKYLASGA